jgi:hypothetical protein
MGGRPPAKASHQALLHQERRRVARFHRTLQQTVGLGAITWFVVDLGGVLGHFCGMEIVGPAVVEHRISWARENGIRPSMSFPLDGPDALVIVEQLAPELVGPVQRRLAGSVAIVIVDADDAAALAWLDDLAAAPGTA